MASLKDTLIATICKNLTQDLTEDVFATLGDNEIEKIKSLLYYKVYAVYLLRNDYTVCFLGVYSTLDLARNRYHNYFKKIPRYGVNNVIPLHRLTIVTYTLETSKGKRLILSGVDNEFNFGIPRVGNDWKDVDSVVSWAYSGSTRCWSPDRFVDLDKDYEKY